MAVKTLFLVVLVPVLVLQLNFFSFCYGARKLTSLYQPPPMTLTYHSGALLEGNLPISLIWYGKFTPPQKSIVVDFLLSLTPPKDQNAPFNNTPTTHPSVSQWWKTIQTYLKKAGKKQTRIVLSTNQISDEDCSLGKTPQRTQISKLARNSKKPGELVIVLTSEDVAVEGFCMSNCGFHGSNNNISRKNGQAAFIFVGNSATQCPGQCAWPFHQPIYGPQTPPLGAPNGDVGVDGMIVNIASLLAGTVTNPFGDGFFLGSADEPPLEAASACPGVYGRGAYPGYAGELLVDSDTGASYNAHGVNGRKYLLPALFDPTTSQCATVV